MKDDATKKHQPIEIRLSPGTRKSATFIRSVITPKDLSGTLSYYAGLHGVSPLRMAYDFAFTKDFINSLSPKQLLQIGAWDDDVIQAAMKLLQQTFL